MCGPPYDTPPPVTDDSHLAAARAAFAGRWDILEVFGGYLAVPDGAVVVQASTLGALVGKLNRRELG